MQTKPLHGCGSLLREFKTREMKAHPRQVLWLLLGRCEFSSPSEPCAPRTGRTRRSIRKAKQSAQTGKKHPKASNHLAEYRTKPAGRESREIHGVWEKRKITYSVPGGFAQTCWEVSSGWMSEVFLWTFLGSCNLCSWWHRYMYVVQKYQTGKGPRQRH